jgi:AraC-like DNA-binding protein
MHQAAFPDAWPFWRVPMRVFTTESQPKTQQFSYWREVLCDEFTALNPVARASDGFDSKVIVKTLLDVRVADVSSKAQSVYRGAPEIRRIPSEYYFANLQLAGECLVRQDGREVLIRQGDFYVVDTTRQYDLIFSDWQILCLRIPRYLLSPLLKAPNRSTAVRVCPDGGMGAITSSFMRSLLDASEELSSESQQVLTSSLANLLAVTLGASSDGIERSRDAVRAEMRSAIVKYIRDRVADPDLCAESAAAHFKISPRYLYKLLESDGVPFGKLVIESRLDRCASDLVSMASPRRSISEIAFKWGFNNNAHFCRVFRDRFGMSASDYRAQHKAPGGAAPIVPTAWNA